MEILEIQKARKVCKIQKKEALPSTSRLEDNIHVSVEAEKRVKWVEMLKAMPDVRQEKIESVTASLLDHEVSSVIAQKLLTEII